MHKARKSKAFNKEVTEMAELKERVAQLEGLLAKQKKCSCSSKPLDAYRRKKYNEMVDTLVELKKKNHSEVYKSDIACPNLDFQCKSSRRPLREFVRRFMSKSDNLVKSKYPDK